MADTYLIEFAGPSGAILIKAVDLGDGTFALATSNVQASANGRTARPTITVDTAAYASLDCVGGIITMASFLANSGGSAKLNSLTLSEAGAQSPALTISLFRATPVGGTYTDNLALATDASDLEDLVAVIDVPATAWKAFGGKTMCTIGGLDMIVDCAATSMFMLIQAQSAYDAVATDDLEMVFGYEEI